MNKKATITDVARLAGVSIKTVSRVANGEANVRETTRQTVQRAIDTLDYRADEHARRLGARRREPAPHTEHLPARPTTDDPLLIDWH
jgi:LacI family transcriptional regulator